MEHWGWIGTRPRLVRTQLPVVRGARRERAAAGLGPAAVMAGQVHQGDDDHAVGAIGGPTEGDGERHDLTLLVTPGRPVVLHVS